MNHKLKTKMARKMLTKDERKIVHFEKLLVKDKRTGKNVEKVVKHKAKTSPFASAAWNARKLAIEKRVERKISKAKALAEKKRQEKENGVIN
jgi:hypothetical protein